MGLPSIERHRSLSIGKSMPRLTPSRMIHAPDGQRLGPLEHLEIQMLPIQAMSEDSLPNLSSFAWMRERTVRLTRVLPKRSHVKVCRVRHSALSLDFTIPLITTGRHYHSPRTQSSHTT
jgi:hypothetical protein